jgi:hypothetical protein
LPYNGYEAVVVQCMATRLQYSSAVGIQAFVGVLLSSHLFSPYGESYDVIDAYGVNVRAM